MENVKAHCREEDFIADGPTNAIADNVAPCAMAENQRKVVHRMQLLLNIVEVHGIQSHMEIGRDK